MKDYEDYGLVILFYNFYQIRSFQVNPEELIYLNRKSVSINKMRLCNKIYWSFVGGYLFIFLFRFPHFTFLCLTRTSNKDLILKFIPITIHLHYPLFSFKMIKRLFWSSHRMS